MIWTHCVETYFTMQYSKCLPKEASEHCKISWTHDSVLAVRFVRDIIWEGNIVGMYHDQCHSTWGTDTQVETVSVLVTVYWHFNMKSGNDSHFNNMNFLKEIKLIAEG